LGGERRKERRGGREGGKEGERRKGRRYRKALLRSCLFCLLLLLRLIPHPQHSLFGERKRKEGGRKGLRQGVWEGWRVWAR